MKTIRMAFLLGASMLVIGGAARAADPVIDVPEMHDWSGIYAGLHAGYGWGDRDWDDDAGFFDDEAFRYDLDGAVLGAQIGYNFQVDSLVFGIEADGSWTDMRDTVVEPFFLGSTTAEAEVEGLATIRGRVGYAWDRFLVYGTGGVAFAKVGTDVDSSFFIFSASDSDSASHTGWVAGVGIEGMITEHISLKAEYLHAGFGKEDFDYFDGNFIFESEGEADLDLDIVRLGVNWHF
jgi:outer membrane immunogenic protein